MIESPTALLPVFGIPEIDSEVIANQQPWILYSKIAKTQPEKIVELAKSYLSVSDHLNESGQNCTTTHSNLQSAYGSHPDTADALNELFSTKTLASNQEATGDQLCRLGNKLSYLATLSSRAQTDTLTIITELDNSLFELKNTLENDSNPAVECSMEYYRQQAKNIINKYQHEIENSIYDYEKALSTINFSQVQTNTWNVGSEKKFSQVSPPTTPGANAKPATVKKWWDSLSQDQQNQLLTNNPTALDRNGIPFDIREKANTSRLATMIKTLEDQKQALLHQKPEALTQDPHELSDDEKNDIQQWKKNYNRVTNQLARLYSVKNALQPSSDGISHHLTYLSEDGTLAAITSGKLPDQAQHVATFVPGTGENLKNISRGVSRGDVLYRTTMHADASSEPSITAWYGYHTPANVPLAASSGYAHRGAAHLDGFQEGIRATNPSANLSIVAHSYGSVVVGQAMQHGRSIEADNIILISPAGLDAHHPNELHMNHINSNDTIVNHIWEDTDANDILRKEQGVMHGASINYRDYPQNNIPQLHPNHHSNNFYDIHHFYNTPLPAAPWDEFKNHSGYWNRDKNGNYNESAINQGRIIAGKTQEVHEVG